MSARNCIDLYEQAVTGSGNPLSVALRDLSAESGMVIDLNTWGKWRRRERTPPPRVLRIINQTVVARALRDAGIDVDVSVSDAALDALAEFLAPPERKR